MYTEGLKKRFPKFQKKLTKKSERGIFCEIQIFLETAVLQC